MLRADQPGAARRHHEHIGLDGDSGEVPGPGMADGHGRVAVEQQVRQRLPHHGRTAHHDRALPGQRDLMMIQQPEYCLGRGGRKGRQARHDAPQ